MMYQIVKLQGIHIVNVIIIPKPRYISSHLHQLHQVVTDSLRSVMSTTLFWQRKGPSSSSKSPQTTERSLNSTCLACGTAMILTA